MYDSIHTYNEPFSSNELCIRSQRQIQEELQLILANRHNALVAQERRNNIAGAFRELESLLPWVYPRRTRLYILQDAIATIRELRLQLEREQFRANV